MNEELSQENTDITEEKQDARKSLPHLFKKGQSGNPKGRPKGSFSLKTYAKNMLEEMTDEQRQEFLDGVDKRIVWEMAEGKAKQDMDINAEVTTKVVSIDE